MNHILSDELNPRSSIPHWTHMTESRRKEQSVKEADHGTLRKAHGSGPKSSLICGYLDRISRRRDACGSSVYDQKKSVAITPSSASIPAPIAPLPPSRMAVWLADAAAMARGGAGARMRVGRWIRRLLITRAARSCVLCLMKVSTGYRLWVGVQRRGGDGRVCLFRGIRR